MFIKKIKYHKTKAVICHRMVPNQHISALTKRADLPLGPLLPDQEL